VLLLLLGLLLLLLLWHLLLCAALAVDTYVRAWMPVLQVAWGANEGIHTCAALVVA
jgi:hypothetical protein